MHGELLYIFGGHDGSQYRNDLLVFNLETRTWILDLDVTGEGPSPRDAHAAVLHGEYMYVFGGYDSKRYLNDFHRFQFEQASWSAVKDGGFAPSPRGGHTAVPCTKPSTLSQWPSGQARARAATKYARRFSLPSSF